MPVTGDPYAYDWTNPVARPRRLWPPTNEEGSALLVMPQTMSTLNVDWTNPVRRIRQPLHRQVAEGSVLLLTTLVTTDQAPTIQLGIDWANDGDITWTSNEDVSSRARQSPAIIATYGRDQSREYQPPRAGKLSFTLDNTDGTFSSLNTSSTLFGKLNPGLLCRLRRTTDGGVTFQYAHTGYTDAPTEQPGIRQQSLSVVSYDALATLKAAVISTAELVNQRIDVAVGACLDAANWPTALRKIALADTTLTRWAVDSVDAFTAIRDLTFSEGPGANFYVDPDTGFSNWENRHYRLLTTRCIQSQMTVRSQGAEPVFGADLVFDTGVRNIVNSCTVPVKTFTLGSLATMWTAPTLVSLAPGEVRALTISTSADWFTAAVVPVLNTDYTLAGTAPSLVLSRTSGKRATLTITAAAGGGCSISNLVIRAQAVTVATTYVSNTLSGAATNGVDYKLRAFPPEFVPSWLPDVNTAADFCNFLVGRYKDPVPTVRVTLNNEVAGRLSSALLRKPGDRLTVIEPLRAFLNTDFWLEQITDIFDQGGAHQQRIMGCEQSDFRVYWILGVAGYGELGSTTVLGY